MLAVVLTASSTLLAVPAAAQTPIETTIEIELGPVPLPPGEETWYGAVVSPAPGGGEATFSLDGEPIAGCETVPLLDSMGDASCFTVASAVGDHVLEVSFAGHGDFLPSSASVPVPVRPASSTRLTSSVGSVPMGQPFDLRVRVRPTPLDGVVRFWSQGSAIDGCDAVPLDGDGRARCVSRRPRTLP